MEIKMKTLTPVHIGSGEVLSPYTDFLKDDKEVCYFDHAKFEEYLSAQDDPDILIDQYVNIVRNQRTEKAKDYSLAMFLAENQLPLEQFTARRVPMIGDMGREEVQRMLTTGNRPFIPGSSIKGAIRTALLYTILKEKGSHFSGILKAKKIYIGQDVFDEYGNDYLKFLHISDTRALDPSQVVVVKTYKLNLLDKSLSIPVSREAIPANTTMTFALKTKAHQKMHSLPQSLRFLYKGGDEEILPLINQFYFDLLEKEIDDLDNKFLEIKSNLIALYNEALQAKEEGQAAVMRIGAGKTFYYNTIASLFSEEEMKSLRNTYDLGENEVFPMTRTIIAETNEVLGWVKLYLQ